MEDLIKKVIYTSAGLVAATAERLQKSIDELVAKGSISEEEGKKVVEDIIEDTESKKSDFETKVKEMIDSVLKTLRLPTPGEIEDLTNRIAALEARIEELTAKKPATTRGRKPAAKTTAKKTTTTAKKTPPTKKKE